MQQVASGVEQQLGGLNRQETAEILHEGCAHTSGMELQDKGVLDVDCHV